MFFLSHSAYNDTKQAHCNTHNCTDGKYFIQKTFSAPNHTKWACPFTQSMLGPCSGLEDSTFGYNCSMPCIIIKMNRVCTIQYYSLVLHNSSSPGFFERCNRSIRQLCVSVCPSDPPLPSLSEDWLRFA